MLAAARGLAAIVAGLVVLFVLVIGVELFSSVVHPFPADIQQTHEEICRHVERYPQWVLAVAVPMWAFAAFAGTWTAGKIGNLVPAAIVGLLLLSALVCNISMLPYPLWFKVACLIVMPLTVLIALRLTARGKVTIT